MSDGFVIPKTPRQRMKESALEQQREIKAIEKFHTDGKVKIAPSWKEGQYEQIFRRDNEIQSD